MDVMKMGLQSGYQLPTRSLQVKDDTLVCAKGPHEGLRVRLDREWMCIGRERWCDVALTEDRRVSREHCMLQVTENGVRVRNLKARNSIYLGDVRIQDAYMQPGSRLRLGETTFALQRRGASMQLHIPHHDPSSQLVGQSDLMRRLFSLLRQLGHLDVPLLLTGDAGVGKRAVARALHAISPRAASPFVIADLESLTPSWMEAYLFGYEANTFANTPERYCGFLEQATGGTLLLHEVAVLPLELQARLLEVVEKRVFFRMGGSEPLPFELRLLSTTSRDLEWAVAERFFLEALEQVLGVSTCALPGLSERREDIALLTDHLLWRLAPERTFRLTPRALRGLEHFRWTGHVAQLEQVLAGCLQHLQGTYIDLDDLRLTIV